MDESRGNRATYPPRAMWRRLGVLAAALLLLAAGARAQSAGQDAKPGSAAANAPAAAPAAGAPAAPAEKTPAAAADATNAASADKTLAPAAPAAIEGVELRKEGKRLQVRFQLSAPTDFEVVGNIAHRVVVVKFRHALPALNGDRRDLAFNDPYLVGISFEPVGQDTWAKLRLRTPALAYSVPAGPPLARMVLALEPAEAPQAIALTSVRLAAYRGGSRIVLGLTERARVEQGREGDVYLLRLKGVSPQLGQAVTAQDARVAVESVVRDGADTVLRLRLKQGNLQTHMMPLPAPPRVVVDVRLPEATAAAAKPAAAAPGPRAPTAPAREIPLETLLGQEKNPLITANYQLAEREYRAGNYDRADVLFLRVFDTAPRSLLGVRAFFRAADAEYAAGVAAKSTNFHGVIINYQSAIRSAEQIGYETALIPRAFFQTGRAYQRMGFHFESNVHFQILQDRFPDNYPYTPDSYYYEGRNDLALEHFDAALQSFNAFLARDGDPELAGPARYQLGDAYFNLKRYVEAKTEFDKGRRILPDYPDERPLLLFHMGEAYYENAEFDVARVLYRTLLDRYPEKSYTKLVGLRLGDFLRDEGKEEEALKVYRQVIEKAPEEIRLRGMLRIANLLGDRPAGDSWREALKRFDAVIAAAQDNPVAQEALLRKALTLTLHGQHQAAIDAFEKLSHDYPDSPYNRDNLIRANIEDNLKSLVDREFVAAHYWDVAKLYRRYRDTYFAHFPYPYTVLEVGKSYQRLGLYDEAQGLYDEVLKDKPGSLKSLAEFQKALALYERDSLGPAEVALLKFIQDHPADPYTTDARMLLGKVYATGRRYEDALNAYRIIVQEFDRTQDAALGESVAEVYFEMGQVYKELGRNKDALDAYRAAVANFHHPIQGANVPEFVILSQFRVGDMLFELGQDREALTAYERAIARYSDHERAPWARYQMGLIYRRLGQDRRALDEFNSLVELAKTKPGELWESLARQNQRDLAAKLDFQSYLKQ